MNLVEKLLKADAGKADECREKKIYSKRLAHILGQDKPAEITIRELKARRLNDFIAKQFDSKGNFEMEKSFDAKALTVGEGVTDPDLGDRRLQEHFGCANKKELAVKLFGNEITAISDAIVELSGYKSDLEMEKEIKN